MQILIKIMNQGKPEKLIYDYFSTWKLQKQRGYWCLCLNSDGTNTIRIIEESSKQAQRVVNDAMMSLEKAYKSSGGMEDKKVPVIEIKTYCEQEIQY